jgi:hypothetical protein
MSKTMFKAFVVEVKDEKGEVKSERVLVDATVESILSVGMKAAAKADNTWRDNFELIIKAFWPKYEPASTDKASAIRTALRDSAEYQKLEGVLMAEHSDAPRLTQALADLAKCAKGSEQADNAQLIVNGLKERVRRVAQRQAITIVSYYADAHGADTSGASKEPKTARELIEETIVDWSAKIESKRRPFDLAGERALLSAAVEALRGVTSKSLQDLADNLGKRIAQPITHPERAAGKVKLLSKEEVEALVDAQGTEVDSE